MMIIVILDFFLLQVLLRIILKVMSMDILHALIVMDQSRILLIASSLILEGVDILLESSAVSS